MRGRTGRTLLLTLAAAAVTAGLYRHGVLAVLRAQLDDLGAQVLFGAGGTFSDPRPH
jgi:hypothetical protein